MTSSETIESGGDLGVEPGGDSEREPEHVPEPRQAPEPRPWRRAFRVATLLVLAVSVWHITTTYTRLSHTVDEPVHVAAGLEWLERGTVRLHAENPPLSRVAVGLGAWLAGHRLGTEGRVFQLGTDVLYADGAYRKNLVRARLGTLPFFLLATGVVWLWAFRVRGERAAFLAASAFCTLPPVMAHAGLATTDVAFTATFLVALYTYVRWVESPTPARTLAFGGGLGLAMITKFSTLLFFPPCAAAVLLVRLLFRRADADEHPPPWLRWIGGACVAVLIAAVVLWGAYGFSMGTFAERPQTQHLIETCFPREGGLGRRFFEWLARTRAPAPDCSFGLLFLGAHGKLGHLAYLFGERSQSGFWSFYPVALAVKTPLVFLALLAGGLFALVRGARASGWPSLAPAAAAVAFLIAAMTTTIHMGLRHALAIYPLLALAAGVGADALLCRAAGKVRQAAGLVVALLLAWQFALVFRIHPDYLSWFNPLAGSDPASVLLESDLDWGQDAFHLEEWFADREDVDRLHVAYFGSVRLCDLDLPPLRWLNPGEPVTGWVAISEMYFRDHWHLVYDDVCDRKRPHHYKQLGGYAWLAEHEPVGFAGRSIRIYYIPER